MGEFERLYAEAVRDLLGAQDHVLRLTREVEHRNQTIRLLRPGFPGELLNSVDVPGARLLDYATRAGRADEASQAAITPECADAAVQCDLLAPSLAAVEGAIEAGCAASARRAQELAAKSDRLTARLAGVADQTEHLRRTVSAALAVERTDADSVLAVMADIRGLLRGLLRGLPRGVRQRAECE